jgi:hypothetical protein
MVPRLDRPLAGAAFDPAVEEIRFRLITNLEGMADREIS